MYPSDLPKLLKDFDDAINYIRKSSIGTPKTAYIDLATAHTDLELNITGNFIYVWSVNNDTDVFSVKFNEQREPAIPLYLQTGWFTPFYRLFITNTAQAGGGALIIYGSLARPFIDPIDNRSPTSLDLSSIRNQLEGDTAPDNWGRIAAPVAAGQIIAANVNRKSVFIQHERGGVGIVYLGCDNTVAAAKHFVSLLPTEWWAIDDYRGAIWAIRSAGVTNLGYLEV